MADLSAFKTRVLPVDIRKLGQFKTIQKEDDLLDELQIELDDAQEDAQNLRQAADQLRNGNLAVAFPTETVYGLGGDATRSESVKSIFRAKQRPADNPLIVHFASLKQLRDLLGAHRAQTNSHLANGSHDDSIPAIYHPLIGRFWPGPLTIILPTPKDSILAPEVTAGLNTFGARIPRHPLALALIQLADVPVAAPSANASTKPSPTAAEHVAHDLDGRIETILDGGPCDVGVESTVVDGLSDPPLILRPGGISLEQLRQCFGWENVQIGYKNSAEGGGKPKAPGMKYRHYSPKATVVLFEAGRSPPTIGEMTQYAQASGKIGIIRTKAWDIQAEDTENPIAVKPQQPSSNGVNTLIARAHESLGFAGLLESLQSTRAPREALHNYPINENNTLLDISLGADTADIARGIFAALRELDLLDVDVILVEGIDDAEGDTAAAVMNRLRKAAEVKVTG